MVESGWAHETLMAMPAREFGDWFAVWAERRKQEADAAKEASKGGK